MQESFDELIDSYLQHQVGISPFFLSKTLAEGLLTHANHLHQSNAMYAAGIGNKKIKDATQSMRTDKIQWLDKSSENEFEQAFLLLMDQFIDRLNETCYAGINASEFHYAVYEKGTSYKRHKDQFQDNFDRKFSLITYLNTDWKEEDGGQLQTYQHDTPQKIQPLAQTAVLFKSNETEHEVTLANRTRLSICGWLKRV